MYKKLSGFLKGIRVEEWVILVSVFVAVLINFLFFGGFSLREFVFLARYFAFGLRDFFSLFYLIILFIFLGKFYVRAAKLAYGRVVEGKRISKKDLKEAFVLILDPLRTIFLLILFSSAMGALLSSMSFAMRFSVKDALFLQLDKAVTGIIPFLELPTVLSTPFFDSLVSRSYISLVYFVGLTALALYFASRRKLFRHFILAFLISTIIAYPIFYKLPCQDPANFFISNIREIEHSQEIQLGLGSYRPSAIVSAGIDRVQEAETVKEKDNTVPISCFPSLHVTWMMFVVYYLARLRASTLFLTVPWAGALLVGGIYLAQHYVIDYVAAIPLAIVSIWLAGLLIRKFTSD